jgi:hypothetical protein
MNEELGKGLSQFSTAILFHHTNGDNDIGHAASLGTQPFARRNPTVHTSNWLSGSATVELWALSRKMLTACINKQGPYACWIYTGGSMKLFASVVVRSHHAMRCSDG